VEQRERWPRTRSPLAWLVTVTELLVGALATGAGLGLGARHLAKAGWSSTAVAGFLLLAIGLGLLGLGVRRLWRSTRRWWRLALVPVGLVAVVVTGSTAIAVMASVVPPTALGPRTPADLGLSYEDVTLTTSDGVRLSAWYVPSHNGAAVVALHGSGSTRTAVLPQAKVLADHGYGVLLLDARGHGDSEGRGMDLGWYGELDVAAAVDHLVARQHVDRDRIGLLGESMGGEEAVGAAGADPRIRAVVAEGATGRTAEDKAAWLPGGVSGTLQRGIDHLTFLLTDLLTPAPHPQPLVASVRDASGTRFLLVTAGSRPDEAVAAAVLRNAAPDRVEVWTVPGAGHTGGLEADADAWTQRVTAFLDRTLRPDRS
jgi:uncharacterized protein